MNIIRIKLLEAFLRRNMLENIFGHTGMGSGDGTTVHLEFERDGTKITVNDEMWGSVSGDELVYFTLAV